jgi:hypothetical protein
MKKEIKSLMVKICNDLDMSIDSVNDFLDNNITIFINRNDELKIYFKDRKNLIDDQISNIDKEFKTINDNLMKIKLEIMTYDEKKLNLKKDSAEIHSEIKNILTGTDLLPFINIDSKNQLINHIYPTNYEDDDNDNII